MLNKAFRCVILYIEKNDFGMLLRKCRDDLLADSRRAAADQHYSIAQAWVRGEFVIGFSRLHAVPPQLNLRAANSLAATG